MELSCRAIKSRTDKPKFGRGFGQGLQVGCLVWVFYFFKQKRILHFNILLLQTRSLLAWSSSSHLPLCILFPLNRAYSELRFWWEKKLLWLWSETQYLPLITVGWSSVKQTFPDNPFPPTTHWLAFWSSFCFCRLVSTYLSTLLSGTHSSQLQKTQRQINQHSKPSHDCLAHNSQLKASQNSGLNSALCQVMDWHNSRPKLPNVPHCLELEWFSQGSVTPWHFQFPKLEGQFRRERTVFNSKEASQERKKYSMLTKLWDICSHSILLRKLPLSIPTFYRLTNSAIGSYCKEKSSDFCLWRKPRWQEYLQNLKWTI